MDDPRSSECYLWDFAKYDQDVARYATVASIVSHISDAFIHSFWKLLEDDRVAKRVSKLNEALRDGKEWLPGIADATWAILAGNLGTHHSCGVGVRTRRTLWTHSSTADRYLLYMGIHGVLAQGMSMRTWTSYCLRALAWILLSSSSGASWRSWRLRIVWPR